MTKNKDKFLLSPVMKVGKFAGKPVDQLPNSYLRWMMTNNFPQEYLEAAKRKLDESPYCDLNMSLSRHALDRFSLRFISYWTIHLKVSKKKDGLATFATKLAEEAWEKGLDVSKNRHDYDGIAKLFNGIVWVFGVNKEFPEYKEVITVHEK